MFNASKGMFTFDVESFYYYFIHRCEEYKQKEKV